MFRVEARSPPLQVELLPPPEFTVTRVHDSRNTQQTTTPGSIAYNVVATQDLVLEKGQVMVGVFDAATGKQAKVKSSIDVDGGQAWKVTLAGNEKSFEQIYQSNMSTDVSEVAQIARRTHETLRRVNGYGGGNVGSTMESLLDRDEYYIAVFVVLLAAAAYIFLTE